MMYRDGGRTVYSKPASVIYETTESVKNEQLKMNMDKKTKSKEKKGKTSESS